MPRPGTTTERGYGNAHQKVRRELEPLVRAGGAVCSRCGLPIVDGKIRLRSGRLVSNWVVDHTDDRSGYLGPAHYRCNARAGRLKRTRREGRRRPRVLGPLSVSRQW